jgi:hypothetical protein
MQPRTAGSGSPGNDQPSVAVDHGAARLVQLVVSGEETVVDQRYLLRRDDVVLDITEPGHCADSPVSVVG